MNPSLKETITRKKNEKVNMKAILHEHCIAWSHLFFLLKLSPHFCKLYWYSYIIGRDISQDFIEGFDLLIANPTKWSNTIKQFVCNSRRIFWVCLTISWGWHLKSWRCVFLKLQLFQHVWSVLRRYFSFRFKDFREISYPKFYTVKLCQYINPFLPNVPFWPPCKHDVFRQVKRKHWEEKV